MNPETENLTLEDTLKEYPKLPMRPWGSGSCIEVLKVAFNLIDSRYENHWKVIIREKKKYFISPEAFDLLHKEGYDFKALAETRFICFNGTVIGAEAVNQYYEDLKNENALPSS